MIGLLLARRHLAQAALLWALWVLGLLCIAVSARGAWAPGLEGAEFLAFLLRWWIPLSAAPATAALSAFVVAAAGEGRSFALSAYSAKGLRWRARAGAAAVALFLAAPCALLEIYGARLGVIDGSAAVMALWPLPVGAAIGVACVR